MTGHHRAVRTGHVPRHQHFVVEIDSPTTTMKG